MTSMAVDRLRSSGKMEVRMKNMILFTRYGINRSAPKETEASNLHPDTYRVLKHSREILAAYGFRGQGKLTVGDLSVASAEKRRREIELFVKKEALGLQDLYIGRKLVPVAQTCESQEILKRMQQSQLEKAREIFEVKQQVFLNTAEEHARREIAEASVEERIQDAEFRRDLPHIRTHVVKCICSTFV